MFRGQGRGRCRGRSGLYNRSKNERKIAFKKWFDEIATKAKEEKKIPILIVHQKSQKSEYIIFDIKDFLKLWKK